MRRNRRILLAVAVAAGAVVLLAGAVLWAMDAAVSWTLGELAAEAPDDGAAAGNPSAPGAGAPAGGGGSGDADAGGGGSASGGAAAGSGGSGDADAGGEPASGGGSPADDGKAPGGGTVPVGGTGGASSGEPGTAGGENGTTGTESTPPELEYEPDISPEKAETVQERVTLAEKATVASTLMKKFSLAELRQFAEIARDGITVDEKRALRGLFVERLSEEEYDKLIAIAAKYGLSQGKKYKQVAAKEQRSEKQ